MENKIIWSKLIEVQKELKTMIKDTKGYGYKYVQLADILESLLPILSKYKIGIMQIPSLNNEYLSLKTILFSDDGEYIEHTSNFPVPEIKGANITQNCGAAISYVRRYCLTSLFAIAEIDSDDLHEKKESEQKQEKKISDVTMNDLKDTFNGEIIDSDTKASPEIQKKYIAEIVEILKETCFTIEDREKFKTNCKKSLTEKELIEEKKYWESIKQMRTKKLDEIF